MGYFESVCWKYVSVVELGPHMSTLLTSRYKRATQSLWIAPQTVFCRPTHQSHFYSFQVFLFLRHIPPTRDGRNQPERLNEREVVRQRSSDFQVLSFSEAVFVQRYVLFCIFFFFFLHSGLLSLQNLTMKFVTGLKHVEQRRKSVSEGVKQHISLRPTSPFPC